MQDKNFDELKARFEKNIYQNIKGDVRANVVLHHANTYLPCLREKPLACADIGGGLGQFSHYLASLGHSVDYFDLSTEMSDFAQTNMPEHLQSLIHFHTGAFQELISKQYDFINCQAVLEWLAEPDKAIDILARHLRPGGRLLLLFYNLDSIKMRNYILGNLKAATGSCRGDGSSLTPINPQTIQNVFAKIEEHFYINQWFGVRCFSDFQHRSVRERLGANVLTQHEIELSEQDPFRALARYIGVIATLK